MRTVLQRVTKAQVRVGTQIVGSIGRGLVLLVGMETGDTVKEVEKTAAKIASLRLFEDDQGKMNLDLAQVDGALLVVSQFTLAGSLAKGRRPSFSKACAPQEAAELIEHLVADFRSRGLRVETGRFQATMEVELVNDGPVTFVFDA